MCPFESRTKWEIKERAERKSELSGREDRPMQCAHLIHGKKYNKNPEMGMYVTDIEHLAHHLMHQQRPRAIGLSRNANDGAIETLCKSVAMDFGCEKMREEVGQAITDWELFYENME